MKKNAKKILCVILGVVMIVSMTGWTTGNVWSPEAYPLADETQPFPTTPIKSDYSKVDKLISENDKYELWWMADNCTVDLIEKETGKRWGVTARQEGEPTVNEETGMPITKHPQISSTVSAEFLNLQTYKTEVAFSAVAAVKNGFVITEDIDNGIKIEYYFDEFKVMVPVEFVLRDNSVAVTVKPTEVLEGEEFRLLSVSIANFWCSTPNDQEDSYLFYPSGSGALVSNESLNEVGSTYTSPVYGFDPTMTRETRTSVEKEIRIPVFGVKNGEIGTCAIIEQNAEAANITAQVGSTSLQYSGIYATYQIRGYTDNYAQSLNNGKTLMQIYAHSMCDKPMTIGFYPLTGDNANYSGMANTYKDYLKSSGAISKVETESNLNVTFIGGVMIDKSFLGLPYTDLVAATTIPEAQNILNELSASTGTKISAKLLGYGSTGLEYSCYSGGFKLNKNLGSTKELDALTNFAKNNNIDVYMEFDLIKLKKSSAGYSTFFDTAYNPLLKVANVYKYHDATGSGISNSAYNLLSRALLVDGAQQLVKKTSKWNLMGYSLGDLSNTAYSDSSTQTADYFVKGNMGKDVTEIAALLAGDNRKISSTEANIYAALVSDVVYDAPTASTGERIFVCDVPFYQMVIKGYVAFSSESMNLAVNPQVHLLKTVETGAGLSYTVINKYYNEFIDYNGYYFYGSLYSDIKDGMLATYASLKDYYAAVNGAEIVSHTILASGLRETVFSNGVKVYVNYTDESITAPSGESVEACGYVWENN